jgi:hypothetical protein
MPYYFSPYFLTLCLIGLGLKVKSKYILVLNLTPRHGDVWISGGILPHIMKIGTRLR